MLVAYVLPTHASDLRRLLAKQLRAVSMMLIRLLKNGGKNLRGKMQMLVTAVALRVLHAFQPAT